MAFICWATDLVSARAGAGVRRTPKQPKPTPSARWWRHKGRSMQGRGSSRSPGAVHPGRHQLDLPIGTDAVGRNHVGRVRRQATSPSACFAWR